MPGANLNPDARHFLLIVVYSGFVLASTGCAHSRSLTPQEDQPLNAAFKSLFTAKSSTDTLHALKAISQATLKKIAVVCVQSDPETNKLVEQYMVPQLAKQGYQAQAAHDIFPVIEQYSPDDLATQLQKQGMNSVAQVTFTGEVSKDKGPDSVHIKFSMLLNQKPSSKDYFRSVALDEAFAVLVGFLTNYRH